MVVQLKSRLSRDTAAVRLQRFFRANSGLLGRFRLHTYLRMIMIKMQNAGLFKHSEAGVCVKASDAISWLQQQSNFSRTRALLIMRRCVHHKIILAVDSPDHVPSSTSSSSAFVSMRVLSGGASDAPSAFSADTRLWRVADSIQQKSRSSLYFIDSHTDSNIIRAAYMVHDAIYELPPRKVTKVSNWLFSVIYSRWMFFLKYTVIACHMAFSFALDRPHDYESPSETDIDLSRRLDACIANSNSPDSLWVLPLELLFSVFYAALCVCSIAAIRFHRSEPWQIFISFSESVVVFVLFLDSIMAISKSNLSGGVQIRFGVPLRPVLVILWSSRIQAILSEVLAACRSLKYMAILTVFWLLISSLFFVQIMRAECGFGDGNRPNLFLPEKSKSCDILMRYFDNSLVGFVSVFILSTGEMYTVITLPLFDMPPQHSFDFIVVCLWTIVTYFIIMAIVLAIIFNAYKEAKRATLIKQSDRLDGCFMDAFKIIADTRRLTVNFYVYARFLECYQPGISSKTVRLYWNNHGKVKVDGKVGINVDEFVELGSILRYKVSSSKKDNRLLKWTKKQGRLGNGLPFFWKIVQKTNFKKMSQAILILNLIQMFVQNALKSNGPNYRSIFEYGGGISSYAACESEVYPSDCRALFFLEIIEIILYFSFGAELLCRVLAYGLSAFFRPWTIFDSIIFVSGGAIYIYQYSVLISNDFSPATLSTLRIFRVIRMLRFFRFSASLQVLLNTMISILPGVWAFASVVSLLIYFYAGVGMMLMQCSGVNSENSNVVNFDTMLGSIIILYQLLTTDAWDSYLWSAIYSHGFKLWISIYFLSYYFLAVMILRNLLVALIVVMADVYVVACVSFFAIGTMKLMMAMITHLIVMVFTLFTPMPPLLLLIGQFCSRFSMFLLQECYDANLGLDIDKPQFTLSPNLNQDEEEEENQEDDDMQVFLQYDRQQVILAHIASFDRAAHRQGNMLLLHQKELLKRTSAIHTRLTTTSGHRMSSSFSSSIRTDGSSRVQLSKAIKDGIRRSVSNVDSSGFSDPFEANSRETKFQRGTVTFDSTKSTSLRNSVSNSNGSAFFIEIQRIPSIIKRCVFVSEYPGSVNALVSHALLCASLTGDSTDPMLIQFNQCFEMLENFGFTVSRTSPHNIISSLCAAALALMNQQAPPSPPTIGAIFAVNIAHRSCAQLQAFIRRKYVLMHPTVRMNATVEAPASSTPMAALKFRAAASADDIADSQRPAFVTEVDDSLLATQNHTFDMRSSLLAPE